MNNDYFLLGKIGSTEMLFMILPIIAICTSIVLILYKRKIPEHEISVPLLIFVYITALVPLGLVAGLYLKFRKKTYNGVEKYKFGSLSRFNSNFVIAISCISILFNLIGQ